MNSKKTIVSATIIGIIIYNIIMFVMPFYKNINFWIIYVSSMISILYAGGVFLTTLTKKGIDRKVKNLPLDWVAWEYLTIQIILGFIELLHPTHYTTSLIINVILLGVNTIALSIVGTEKKEIERVEKKVQEKVFFIKSLQEDIQTIKDKVEDEKTKNTLEDLLQVIKYSDPMSSNRLFEIENDIEIKVSNLKENIEERKTEETIETITKIKTLLAERNRKAKMYKGMPDEEKNKEKDVNTRAVIISSVSIVVLIIVGIVSYYSIIIPNKQYTEAEKLLNNKQYKEAKIAFQKMYGYKDSEDKANEAMYQYATELFDKKQYSNAKEEFATLGDYKDSEDKTKQASYEYATELLENKEYSKSASEFWNLDNYKDSKGKLIEIYNLFGEQDVVYFGKYKGSPIAWQILETRKNQVLLITRDVIDEMAYNTEYKTVEWENSSIRKWLNEEFYNSFDEKEKARILTNITDKVFLFTDKNIEKYTKIKNINKTWWLVPNGDEKTKAMYVKENGTVDIKGDIVTKLHGVRPVIWLDLN